MVAEADRAIPQVQLGKTLVASAANQTAEMQCMRGASNKGVYMGGDIYTYMCIYIYGGYRVVPSWHGPSCQQCRALNPAS